MQFAGWESWSSARLGREGAPGSMVIRALDSCGMAKEWGFYLPEQYLEILRIQTQMLFKLFGCTN